jgi:homoserine O-acetyltransferase
MVDALAATNKDVSYCDIASPYGHDAFLLEPEILGAYLCCFLQATYRSSLGHEPCSCPMRSMPAFGKLEEAHRARVDYELIESLIEPNSRVLDVGCGNGELLANLVRDKNIKGEGIELDQELVLDCVCQGLPIIQQDIEGGLGFYGDKNFDYVILSQTVQTVKEPEKVFAELLRVGKKVIVSFPNFAHWRCRSQLFFTGHAPVTKQLPFDWHNTPNIHCLSLKDFDRFCQRLGAKVEKRIPLVKTRLSPVRFAPNLFAEQVIYVTSKE